MSCSSFSNTLGLVLFTSLVFVVTTQDVPYKICVYLKSYSGIGHIEGTTGVKSFVVKTVTEIDDVAVDPVQGQLDMTKKFNKGELKPEHVHGASLTLAKGPKNTNILRVPITVINIEASVPDARLIFAYEHCEICNFKIVLEGTTYYSSVEVLSDNNDEPYLILLEMEGVTSDDDIQRYKDAMARHEPEQNLVTAIYPTGIFRETGISEKCDWLSIDIIRIVPGRNGTQIFYKLSESEKFDLGGKIDLQENIPFKIFIPDEIKIIERLSVARIQSKTKQLSELPTALGFGWDGLLSLSGFVIDQKDVDVKQLLKHPAAQFSIHIAESWYLLKQLHDCFKSQSTILAVISAKYEPKLVLTLVTVTNSIPSAYYGYVDKKENEHGMKKYLELAVENCINTTHTLKLYQNSPINTNEPYKLEATATPEELATKFHDAAVAEQSFVPETFDPSALSWSIIRVFAIKAGKSIALQYEQPEVLVADVIVVNGPTTLDKADAEPKMNAFIYSFDKKEIMFKPKRDGVEELNRQYLLEWSDLAKNNIAKIVGKKFGAKLFVRTIGETTWNRYTVAGNFMGVGYKLLVSTAPTEIIFWMIPENFPKTRITISCIIDQLAETILIKASTKAKQIPVSGPLPKDLTADKQKDVEWKTHLRGKSAKTTLCGINWLSSYFTKTSWERVTVIKSFLSDVASLLDRGKDTTITYTGV